MQLLIASNPASDSSLPYLMLVPIGDGLVFRTKGTWPRTSALYCHPVPRHEWPAKPDLVEEIPLRGCERRGAAIDLIADRGREQRSQLVFTSLTRGHCHALPRLSDQPDPVPLESQSVTSAASPTGQRYLNGSSTKLLFVRQHKSDEFGTSPYLFAGPARYVQHTGERPIAITWKLDHALPNDFFLAATVAR